MLGSESRAYRLGGSRLGYVLSIPGSIVIWVTNLFLLIGIWLAGLILRVARPLLAVAILYGAWLNLSPLPTEIAVGTLFMWVSKNWIAFALAGVVMNSASAASRASDAAKYSHMSLTGLVAMGNYLGIGLATDATKRMDEIGALKLMKTSIRENLIFFLLGISRTDDALSAKPTRNGKVVSLRDDLAEGYLLPRDG